VAEDTTGRFNWTPYRGFINCIILQTFGVSVGSNRPPPIPNHDLPANCHVFMKLPIVRDT